MSQARKTLTDKNGWTLLSNNYLDTTKLPHLVGSGRWNSDGAIVLTSL